MIPNRCAEIANTQSQSVVNHFYNVCFAMFYMVCRKQSGTLPLRRRTVNGEAQGNTVGSRHR